MPMMKNYTRKKLKRGQPPSTHGTDALNRQPTLQTSRMCEVMTRRYHVPPSHLVYRARFLLLLFVRHELDWRETDWTVLGVLGFEVGGEDGVIVPSFGFGEGETGAEGVGEEKAGTEARVLEEEDGRLEGGVEDEGVDPVCQREDSK
jgi:hypothetical protein